MGKIGTTRKLLMTTVMASTSLVVGYGRRAYAACINTGGTNYLCSGPETTTQTIAGNDASVTTGAGFSVNTLTGRAIHFSGNGALTFIDNSGSIISSPDAVGIFIHPADNGGTPGSITLDTDSDVHGFTAGINAFNYGVGVTSVTVDGDVTSDINDAIYVRNNVNGADVTITTGAGSTVQGGGGGIRGLSNGIGALLITANGNVTGNSNYGIAASNTATGTNVTIETGAGTTVHGDDIGILTFNYGTGALSITADGNVTANNDKGIAARNHATSLTIETGSGTTVQGHDEGISAYNYGTGATLITVDGDVTSVNRDGIYAYNSATTTNLTVETAAGTTIQSNTIGIRAGSQSSGAMSITMDGDVMSGTRGIVAYTGAAVAGVTIGTGAGSSIQANGVGIFADNDGVGALSITVDGDLTSATDNAISANNASSTTDITIETGAGSAVQGNTVGIQAFNYGTGATSITVNGDVTGTTDRGIYAYGDASTTNMTIETGVGSDVEGNTIGIRANNLGSGATTVTMNGDVTGNGAQGLLIDNSANGTTMTVETGAGSSVQGTNFGIRADNKGTGATSVTVDGNVTGAQAVFVQNRLAGTDVTLETGAGSNVQGVARGIFANNNGTGSISVTVDGDVSASAGRGIYAYQYTTGHNMTIETGAGSSVQGTTYGIRAYNNGLGATSVTANGDVTGTANDAIRATSIAAGMGITIETGAGTTMQGGNRGIDALNYGNGALSVTANGNVTGNTSDGIKANNRGNGTSVTIQTGAGTTVQGDDVGVYGYNLGSGAMSITVNGDVTATTLDGIRANNRASGTNLTIQTGAGTTVHGDNRGINAFNVGTGAVSITANGNVTGDTYEGIYGYNSAAGTNLTIETGTGTTALGNYRGIDANNKGAGTTSVTVGGNVTGTTSHGIRATNDVLGTNLTIETDVGTVVHGDVHGIDVDNKGTGATSITANGDVTGDNSYAINAVNRNNTTNLTIETGVGTTLQGGGIGIAATNNGNGATSLMVRGNVTGVNGRGINVYSDNTTTDMTIQTDAGTTVYGKTTGLDVYNYGNGATSVTLDGNVTGHYSFGLEVDASGTDLTIETGAGTTLYGFTKGMDVYNWGSGDASITVNGDITSISNGGYGIDAVNRGNDMTIETGAGTTVQGGRYGIRARNQATGILSITVGGDVTGTGTGGIAAYQNGTNLMIETDAGTTVQGDYRGMTAFNDGSGSTSVTVGGNVTGVSAHGLYVYNGTTATDMSVVTEANSAITGLYHGIRVENKGTGDTIIDVSGAVSGGAGYSSVFAVGTTDDELILRTGANLSSVIGANLGAGNDTLTLEGHGNENERFLNIETLNINADGNATGWVLTGVSSFDDVNVNTGRFANNGTLTVSGDLTVAGGATFGGSGTLIGNLISNGVVGPGNSIATQTINGNFTQGGGGRLDIEFDNGTIDLLDITGTANLAGAVRFTELGAGTPSNTPFTFLQAAGGITGTFATSSTVFLTGSGLGSADLSYTATTAAVTFGQFVAQYQAQANTGSGQSAGAALDAASVTDPAGMVDIINALNASSNIADALASQAGDVQKSVFDSGLSAMGRVSDIAMNRLNGSSGAESGMSAGESSVVSDSGAFWMHGIAGKGGIDSDANARGSDYTLLGTAFGMESYISDDMTYGAFGGWTRSESDLLNLRDEAQTDSYQFGAYLGTTDDRWTVNGTLSAAYFEVDSTRPTASGVAKGDTDGWGMFAASEARYDLVYGDGYTLSPLAGLEYAHAGMNSYTENGAGALNMHYKDNSMDKLTSLFGAQLSASWDVDAFKLQPSVKLAWAHNYLDQHSTVGANFASNSAVAFNSDSPDRNRDSARIGFDFGLAPAGYENFSTYISYDGDIASNAQDHVTKLGAKWKW